MRAAASKATTKHGEEEKDRHQASGLNRTDRRQVQATKQEKSRRRIGASPAGQQPLQSRGKRRRRESIGPMQWESTESRSQTRPIVLTGAPGTRRHTARADNESSAGNSTKIGSTMHKGALQHYKEAWPIARRRASKPEQSSQHQ